MVQPTQWCEWVLRDWLWYDLVTWYAFGVYLYLTNIWVKCFQENSLMCVREKPFQAPVSWQNVWQVYLHKCGNSEMGLCGSSWWWFWDLLLSDQWNALTCESACESVTFESKVTKLQPAGRMHHILNIISSFLNVLLWALYVPNLPWNKPEL